MIFSPPLLRVNVSVYSSLVAPLDRQAVARDQLDAAGLLRGQDDLLLAVDEHLHARLRHRHFQRAVPGRIENTTRRGQQPQQQHGGGAGQKQAAGRAGSVSPRPARAAGVPAGDLAVGSCSRACQASTTSRASPAGAAGVLLQQPHDQVGQLGAALAG